MKEEKVCVITEPGSERSHLLETQQLFE